MSLVQLAVFEVNILLNYPDISGSIVRSVVALYHSIQKYTNNSKSIEELRDAKISAEKGKQKT